MKSFCISSLLSLFLLISLSSVHSSPIEDSEKEAEPEQQPEVKDYIKKCFARINKYREKHGSPALKIDSQLNNAAESCARLYEGGAPINSCPRAKGSSENSAASPDLKISFEELCLFGVNAWYAQHKKYNYEHPNVTDWRNTGSFTSMVWKSSTDGGLGCFRGTTKTQCVALFRPQGNKPTIEAFKANVLPPQKDPE